MIMFAILKNTSLEDLIMKIDFNKDEWEFLIIQLKLSILGHIEMIEDEYPGYVCYYRKFEYQMNNLLQKLGDEWKEGD